MYIRQSRNPNMPDGETMRPTFTSPLLSEKASSGLTVGPRASRLEVTEPEQCTKIEDRVDHDERIP